jgi:hypothetical protein
MKHQAYRCCLPTLAGFASIHCIGPGFQRRPAVRSPTSPPPRGIPPGCSGLPERGTANSPPSTTKLFAGVEALLRSALMILSALHRSAATSVHPKEHGANSEKRPSETTCSESFRSCSTTKNWSQRSESNRRPAVYETAALPAELRWLPITSQSSFQAALQRPAPKAFGAALPQTHSGFKTTTRYNLISERLTPVKVRVKGCRLPQGKTTVGRLQESDLVPC